MTERREDYPEIKERLARIEEKSEAAQGVMERIEKRLFGNGQEGEISKINKRLRVLENWKWYVAGAIALLLALHHEGLVK